MATRTRVLLLLAPAAALRVALLSDLHVGEACLPIPYNGTDDCACVRNDARAIARINALAPQPDAVLVTGDITSSAWPTQWVKARQLLDGLRAPYAPAMGNHDVWAYDREGGNETAGPFGDAAFGATFGDVLRSWGSAIDYAPAPVHNPQHNTTSNYQNWMLTLTDVTTGARVAFVAGDWSTRERAPPGDSGVPGWAERGLGDFAGGPLPWLRAALARAGSLPPGARPDALWLVQHQPIKCPFYMPDLLFCFGAADKALLADAMLGAWPKSSWGGSLAGHIHLFANDSGDVWGGDAWPAFRELETSAAKGDGVDADAASAFTVVDFAGTRVAHVQRQWFRVSEGAWVVEDGE